MMGENYNSGWGGGASCTNVRECVIFVPITSVFSSSLRSLSDLTSIAPLKSSPFWQYWATIAAPVLLPLSLTSSNALSGWLS